MATIPPIYGETGDGLLLIYLPTLYHVVSPIFLSPSATGEMRQQGAVTRGEMS
jgi:hypothetical protein